MEELVFAHEEIPMPGTYAGLLEVLRRVLSKPYVQEVSLEVDRPIRVGWHKADGDELLLPPVDDTIETTLLTVEIVDVPGSKIPDVFHEALFYVSQRRLFPLYVVVSSEKRLKELFNLPWSTALAREEVHDCALFCGLRVVEAQGFIDDDQIIVLGVPDRQSATSEAKIAVRFVP